MFYFFQSYFQVNLFLLKKVLNEKKLRNLNYDKEKKIFNHTSEDLTAILDFENYKVDFRYSLINFELFDHKFEIEYILYSSVKDGYFYNDLKQLA